MHFVTYQFHVLHTSAKTRQELVPSLDERYVPLDDISIAFSNFIVFDAGFEFIPVLIPRTNNIFFFAKFVDKLVHQY